MVDHECLHPLCRMLTDHMDNAEMVRLCLKSFDSLLQCDRAAFAPILKQSGAVDLIRSAKDSFSDPGDAVGILSAKLLEMIG